MATSIFWGFLVYAGCPHNLLVEGRLQLPGVIDGLPRPPPWVPQLPRPGLVQASERIANCCIKQKGRIASRIHVGEDLQGPGLRTHLRLGRRHIGLCKKCYEQKSLVYEGHYDM